MPTTFLTVSQCDDFGNRLKVEIEKFYAPRIDPVVEKINAEKKAGRDPSQYKPNEAITINLIKLLDQIVKAKSDSYEQMAEKVSECKKGSIPDAVGEAQKFQDLVTVLTAVPFLVLLGDYRAVNVDLGEIFKGKLLGGDNAFVPQVRKETLDRLGISGDVRKIIEQPESLIKVPAAAVQDAVNSALKSIGIPWKL